jgi:hypothetical protein
MSPLNRLMSKIGETLDDAYGPFGEFSVDLGMDRDNRCWIFEINSKPMVFDETDIQEKWEERWYHQMIAMTAEHSTSHINMTPPTHTNQ